MSYPQIHTTRIEGKKNITIHYVIRKTSQAINLPPSLLFDSSTQDNLIREIYLTPPHVNPNLSITYEESPFLDQAEKIGKSQSLTDKHSTATVLVANNEILTGAVNGTDYHQKHPCKRVQMGLPSGIGYELCEGCHPKYHSESKALRQLAGQQKKLNITAYLWGHWWCCEYCSKNLVEHNITNVVLSKSWTQTFTEIDISFLN